MILAIRTDKPEAELYLYNAEHGLIDSYTWSAHRELSLTLLKNIEKLLKKNSLTLKDLRGLIAYRGPGSFTGLRIGLTVANTIAYTSTIPIVGANGEQWRAQGLKILSDNSSSQFVAPLYGSEAHVTAPRK